MEGIAFLRLLFFFDVGLAAIEVVFLSVLFVYLCHALQIFQV